MCGIHASISKVGFQPPSDDLKRLICSRGPDHLGEIHTKIQIGVCPYSLSFTSTVLALRGDQVQAQPFTDRRSDAVFCWNGEAWKIGEDPVLGNDGQRVFDSLILATQQELSSSSTQAILNVLRSISGPFAFIFLDKIHERLYFGRDRLGRRSLLYSTQSHPGCMEFASTSDPGNSSWKEVEADAIYQLSFQSQSERSGPTDISDHLLTSSLLPIQKFTWTAGGLNCSPSAVGAFNRSITSEVQPLTARTASVQILKNHLCESLKLRILNVLVPPRLHDTCDTRIGILFSGGLDCTVVARMVHDLLPPDQHIDLLNVAFENPRVVQAAKTAPPKSKKKSKQKLGDDSPHDDILNIPSRNPTESSPYESCPDRETGRKSFQELQEVCPGRLWRFIAVDIPYSETVAHRSQVVSLIHPHNTEMDLSIAYALYFAARGEGLATTSLSPSPQSYQSPVRVLLSGLGADELFGGYTRHATAFGRSGFLGLLDELELDVNRLGQRNLGRDDRVISHWGREARFPYLDESLLKWAVECPIWEKCGFQTTPSDFPEEPDIEPGKKVLRLLAYDLGMPSVAKEKKRAIQFGARTAKMEVGRTKGTTLIDVRSHSAWQ